MSHLLQRPGFAYRGDALIGVALVLLGSTTVVGWLLHVPAMVEVKSGLVPMVFNTGLCFLLSGIGLVLSGPNATRFRSVRTGIGAFLVCLCSLTLLEHFFDRSLGVDMASVHAWYDYGNTRPGRMAPNSASGFVLIGLAYLLSHRVATRRAALGVVTLTFCVLAVGLTGLVGYLLAPDLLFGWARSARMAVHTATGMILCAIGLWLWWSKSQWYTGEQFFREDGKIRFLSAAILIIVTLTMGLTGFVLLQGSLEKALESRLETVVDSRSPWFRTTSTEAARHALVSLSLAEVNKPAEALLADSRNSRAAAQFDALARRLIKEGYRGVAIEDASRHPVRMFGNLAGTPAFTASLAKADTVQLLWDSETVVTVRQTLMKDGKQIGSIRIDKAMPELEKSLLNMERLGSTAELAVCVRSADALACMPNSRNASVFTVDLRSRQGKTLPMELALAGKAGIIYTLDYRNQNVIAAYGELVPGLGLVAKQDTKEAYGVIRDALAIGVPIVLVASVLGAILLYSQLNPLVTRMRRSEQELARLAQYDTLTGLPNRALFMDRLNAAALRVRRSGSAMALMFVDLDGFKKVNDTFGHQGGDELLLEVAKRLSSAVRESDTVARLAGDEFTIILEGLANPANDAKELAGKIIDVMRAPFQIGQGNASVTASLGLVLHDTHAGDIDLADLLHRADEQMYAAKHAGKNRFRMEAAGRE